jgi:hypothetical protein
VKPSANQALDEIECHRRFCGKPGVFIVGLFHQASMAHAAYHPKKSCQ